MQSVLEAVFGMMMFLVAGQGLRSAYTWVERETLTKIAKGLPPLEGYARKLTHPRATRARIRSRLDSLQRR